MLMGLILIVISVYLLIDILETAQLVGDGIDAEVEPETTGDWYLAKLFGYLFLLSLGLTLAILNLVRLFNGKKKED